MNAKHLPGIQGLVILVLMLAACGQPTSTPTAAPTAAAATPTVTAALPTLTARPTQAIVTPTAPITPEIGPTPLAAPSVATRLRIPALQLDAPVIEVGWRIETSANGERTTVWEIAENAAGHHINSAAPGMVGNAVISGHNNSAGKVFEALSLDIDRPTPRLTVGSDIELETDQGRRLIYRVQRIELAPETGAPLEQRLANAKYLEQTPDATLTLITCWPSFGNTHRVIVIARLAQVF